MNWREEKPPRITSALPRFESWQPRLPRTPRGTWKAFARSCDHGQRSNSSASIWSATCARTRCPTRSGNYRRPRHDNKRLTNSAQLMEPDTCP